MNTKEYQARNVLARHKMGASTRLTGRNSAYRLMGTFGYVWSGSHWTRTSAYVLTYLRAKDIDYVAITPSDQQAMERPAMSEVKVKKLAQARIVFERAGYPILARESSRATLYKSLLKLGYFYDDKASFWYRSSVSVLSTFAPGDSDYVWQYDGLTFGNDSTGDDLAWLGMSQAQRIALSISTDASTGQTPGAPSTHYIALAGLHGCLPNYCASYETRGQAIDSLADLHELPRYGQLMRDLRSGGYCELKLQYHGNEYAEIQECTCDDPDSHCDY